MGTSTAAVVAALAAVAAAADAQKGGWRGSRHAHSTNPPSPSTHVPPFSQGQMRGIGLSGSTAIIPTYKINYILSKLAWYLWQLSPMKDVFHWGSGDSIIQHFNINDSWRLRKSIENLQILLSLYTYNLMHLNLPVRCNHRIEALVT